MKYIVKTAENFLNKIICNDALKITPIMPDNFIDLVITSPPYNLGIKNYDNYKDNKEYILYIRWLKKIFKQIYPKLKPGGRIAIIIGEGKHGRIPTHIDIANLMIYKLGYLPMSTIIWNKRNVSNRLSWGTFKSPLAPSLPTPFEYILVYAKESYKLSYKGTTDIKKEEFINWSSSLWTLPRYAYKKCNYIIKNEIHPAPFPEEIPVRLMKFFSWIGAVVYDPFVGIGTTAIAAKKNGRVYVGVDLSQKYCQTTEESLRNIVMPYTFDFKM